MTTHTLKMRTMFLALGLGLVALVNPVDAATIDDIETATGGTYLDFEFNQGGEDGVYTRNGLTATGTGSGWGFPNVVIGVSGGTTGAPNLTGMRGSGSEFRIDVTGLTASSYTAYVTGLGNSSTKTWGFEWGTASGSLTSVPDFTSVAGTIDISNNAGNVSYWAAPIGSFSPAGGSLTFFIDGGGATFLDGIALVAAPAAATVPEPTAFVLAMFGLFGLSVLRRRRNRS